MERKTEVDPYSLDSGAKSEPTPAAPPTPPKEVKPGLDLDAPIAPKEKRAPIDPAAPPPPPKTAEDDAPPPKAAAGSGRFTDTMTAGVHVIQLTRNDVLDAEYIERVGDDIYHHLKPHAKPKVVVDLANVQFMSSSALGMLLALRKVVNDKMEGAICIANVGADMKQVFKLTNLHKLMKLHNSTDKAIKSLL